MMVFKNVNCQYIFGLKGRLSPVSAVSSKFSKSKPHSKTKKLPLLILNLLKSVLFLASFSGSGR